MMRKKCSKEEKAKYVEGFKKCTLTAREYAEKMKIDYKELKTWLKENTRQNNFGEIKVSELLGKQSIGDIQNETSLNKTSIKFECDTIK